MFNPPKRPLWDPPYTHIYVSEHECGEPGRGWSPSYCCAKTLKIPTTPFSAGSKVCSTIKCRMPVLGLRLGSSVPDPQIEDGLELLSSSCALGVNHSFGHSKLPLCLAIYPSRAALPEIGPGLWTYSQTRLLPLPLIWYLSTFYWHIKPYIFM